ncbi:MPT63 family protein [Mycobacterium sp. ACS4331]|uniref:MPT63 family protein n=1 Tax=Mycobacterium sp. ACS4331 TaxID=1834121 RepID=UPI0007FF5044|nr:MPT63 family protein [Mycobacterium sp. ACS4331]OBF11334.1 hypothetical protein A5727_20595 [Mycobacterium sp. ACS4331]
MKTRWLVTTAASAALFAAGLLGGPLANAETTEIGSQGRLDDGGVVQGWTIADLKQSADAVPYAVRGTLWEATATNEAIQGTVLPIISNLNARSESGDSYRVLFQIASPQGISPNALAQGEKSTGKLYFDVTGAAPDTVVYNNGTEDLLVWVTPAPEPARSTSSAATANVPTAPAAEPAADAPAAAPETEPASTPATGRQGTPLPEDATVAEDVATPEAAPVEAAPAPAAPATSAPEAPVQGTPHGPSAAATPAPGSQGTPVQGTPHGPAQGSQGTPLPVS